MSRIVVFLCVLLACSSKKATNEEEKVSVQGTASAPSAPDETTPGADPGPDDQPTKVEPEVKTEETAKMVGGMPANEIVGHTGFDWFSSGSACELASDTMVGKWGPGTSCERKTEDTFGTGTDRDVIHCKLNEKSEWLLFESAAVCIEMLETMNANGP